LWVALWVAGVSEGQPGAGILPVSDSLRLVAYNGILAPDKHLDPGCGAGICSRTLTRCAHNTSLLRSKYPLQFVTENRAVIRSAPRRGRAIKCAAEFEHTSPINISNSRNTGNCSVATLLFCRRTLSLLDAHGQRGTKELCNGQIFRLYLEEFH
jgi:hypothetical protein